MGSASKSRTESCGCSLALGESPQAYRESLWTGKARVGEMRGSQQDPYSGMGRRGSTLLCTTVTVASHPSGPPAHPWPRRVLPGSAGRPPDG
jgi:hypothetical protein